MNCCVDTCHGMAPLVPLSVATSPKMTPVQVPATGLGDIDVAVVSHSLGQAVRSEPSSGSIRIRRTRALSAPEVAGVGNGGVQPVLAGLHGEVDYRVIVLLTRVIQELWARGVIQRHAAGLHVLIRAKGPAGHLYCLVLAPVLVIASGHVSLVPGFATAFS